MLLKLRHILLLISFIAILPISNAIAQTAFNETKQYGLASEKVFNLPPPDQIEKRFLNEMDQIYRECQTDHDDSGHRDCQCYAMSFLEDRLKYKNVSKEVIKTGLRQVCLDPKKMEGFYFGKCASMINVERLIQMNKDPNEVCDCYAKKVPEMILNLKFINAKTLNEVRKVSHTQCGLF